MYTCVRKHRNQYGKVGKITSLDKVLIIKHNTVKNILKYVLHNTH